MRAASLTRLVMAAVACSALALPVSAAAQSARDRNSGWQNDRGWENRAGGEAYQRGFRDGERLGDRTTSAAIARSTCRAIASIARPTRATTATTARGIAIATSSGAASPRAIASATATIDGMGIAAATIAGATARGTEARIATRARRAASATATRKGADDRRDNHRFEPERFKEVKKGTAPGYDDEFGSRERYTFSYRDGFRQGYEDGFRSAYARR